MTTIEIVVTCPYCNSDNVVKNGKSREGKQRFLCKNEQCNHQTFLIEYEYTGSNPQIKKKILNMAINGSGIRDTARVLGISPNTVILNIKASEKRVESVNYELLKTYAEVEGTEVDLVPINSLDSELDEMWSFVQNKSEQRWLWLAIDHNTGDTIAYVFGRRKDIVFLELKKLLEPFKIRKYYTDNWGAYSKNLDEEQHIIGKTNTQTIERKNLTIRTRIKRLARKTICFSKSIKMHDIVIGLLINVLDFGLIL